MSFIESVKLFSGWAAFNTFFLMWNVGSVILHMDTFMETGNYFYIGLIVFHIACFCIHYRGLLAENNENKLEIRLNNLESQLRGLV